jgi:PAS domain S-box-containing protein
MEIRFITATGNHGWTRTICQPYTVDGKVSALKGVFQDITDHKRAEEALEQSEALYRTLVENCHDIIFIVDLTGKFLFTNAAFHRVLGFSEQDIQSINGFELVHPDDLSEVQQVFARLPQGLIINTLEYRYRKHDGNFLCVATNAVPLYNASGNVYAALGISRDVTERKQVEETLEHERQQMEVILSALNTGLSLISKDMTVQWVNEKIRSMFPPEDPIGKTCYRFYEERETICPQCGTLQSFDTGEICEIERYNPRDGRWYYIISQPIQDASGTVINVLEAISDITARKRAEEALRESEERFRSIFEYSPLGIAIGSTADHRLLQVNPRLCEILGYTEHDLLKLTVSDITHPDDFEAELTHSQDVLTGKEPVYSLNKRYIRKDGTLRWVRVTTTVLPDPEGGPLLGLGIIEDITDRKQMEEQIKASLREKEVLLREIHHRVKNNLMVVTSLIEMQAEETTNPEALQLFRDLRNRVLAMSMVHEDLYQSENLEQIAFDPYLERLVNNIRQGFAKVPAAIKIVADDIILDVNTAVPCGLIVAELVTNAFKYAFPSDIDIPSQTEGMLQQPEIRVEMRYVEPAYTLSVSDNGVGLPPGVDWRKANTLGMTLVRSWAVHQLSGEITVDSRAGTQVMITFTQKRSVKTCTRRF